MAREQVRVRHGTRAASNDNRPTIGYSFDPSAVAHFHEELNRICEEAHGALTARDLNARAAEILMRASRELRKMKPG
ncbi:MAG: hypothetical protein AB7S92_07450 [Parvibaculaceae bacterium]